MDIAKAFTYVTEDPKWMTKLGIAVVISLLSFLIIPIPLLMGYMVAITRNVRDGVKEPLPEWDDFGAFFRDGLSLLVAQLVYTLPFWLLACIVFFSTVGFSGLAEMNEDAAIAGMFATFGLVLCLGLLFAVALLFISPAIVLQYVNTDQLGACFRFGEVLGLARQHLGDIVMVLLVSFGAGLALGVVSAVLNVIPCLGQIVSVVLSIVAGPYLMAATGHLYGQIALKAGGKGFAY